MRLLVAALLALARAPACRCEIDRERFLQDWNLPNNPGETASIVDCEGQDSCVASRVAYLDLPNGEHSIWHPAGQPYLEGQEWSFDTTFHLHKDMLSPGRNGKHQLKFLVAAPGQHLQALEDRAHRHRNLQEEEEMDEEHMQQLALNWMDIQDGLHALGFTFEHDEEEGLSLTSFDECVISESDCPEGERYVFSHDLNQSFREGKMIETKLTGGFTTNGFEIGVRLTTKLLPKVLEHVLLKFGCAWRNGCTVTGCIRGGLTTKRDWCFPFFGFSKDEGITMFGAPLKKPGGSLWEEEDGGFLFDGEHWSLSRDEMEEPPVSQEWQDDDWANTFGLKSWEYSTEAHEYTNDHHQ
ncbi:unnamed protein product [Chrysoparadoxa australica]